MPNAHNDICLTNRCRPRTWQYSEFLMKIYTQQIVKHVKH